MFFQSFFFVRKFLILLSYRFSSETIWAEIPSLDMVLETRLKNTSKYYK